MFNNPNEHHQPHSACNISFGLFKSETIILFQKEKSGPYHMPPVSISTISDDQLDETSK